MNIRPSTQRQDGEKFIPFTDVFAGTSSCFRGWSQFASLLLRAGGGPLRTWVRSRGNKPIKSGHNSSSKTSYTSRDLLSDLAAVWAFSSNLLKCRKQRQSGIFCGVYRLSKRPCEARAGCPNSPSRIRPHSGHQHLVSTLDLVTIHNSSTEKRSFWVQSTLCHGGEKKESRLVGHVLNSVSFIPRGKSSLPILVSPKMRRSATVRQGEVTKLEPGKMWSCYALS